MLVFNVSEKRSSWEKAHPIASSSKELNLATNIFLANINKTKSPVLVHGKKHARHQTSEAAFLKQNFIHLTSDHLLDYFRIMIYDYDVGNMYFFQHYLSVCH